MLRLLVFLSLIIWTHGQDGGFGTFCKSELGGQLVADECHQSYNLPNLPENSAEALCSYRSPYAVKNAKADSNGLSCIFNKPGDCGNAHYIHGFCYKLAASCTGEWALFSLSDKWTFRWLVLHFSAIKKAIVALPKKHKAPTAVYHEGTLLPATEADESKEKAVLLSRMSAFAAYPGDIVHVDEQVYMQEESQWRA